MIGKTVSHYQIIEEIGRGGMGVVYKARDLSLDRLVALKFLPAQFNADEEEKKRFVHEAKAASALDHANICSVYEIGETPEGQLFIAMGYYEGKTLKELITVGARRAVPLPFNDVINIAMQVAEGLQEAHRKGIVHRDLKPANIMVTEQGVVKIVDFGLAKLKGMSRLTKSGTTLGTVAYMSPEQALGKEVDQRTDIWSLGVILYEMLTGKLPFPGEYDQAMLYAVINEEPERLSKARPEATPGLEQIVGKALAKDPTKRYQAVADFLQDLKAITTGFMPSNSRLAKAGFFGIQRIYIYTGLAIVAAVLVGLNIGRISSLFTKKTEAAVIRSLAVLPLANLSGDPAQEYFCDGMTDVLIAGLAQIKALKVISRTSVMQYKEARKPLPQIARELGVEGIIEGSVMRSGNRVRITAQLIDARQDRHLWANNYEREMTDVLALQAEVVREITGEIRAQVTPQERERLSATRTVDPEAFQAYLMGRFFYNKTTAPALEKSIEHFKKSIERDPQYAAAYAELANAYATLGTMGTLPIAEFTSKEREAALKALEIDDTLAEGHAALGIVKFNDWDWDGAAREYKRAIELNPNYALAYDFYSQILLILCRQEESLAASVRARELDPLNLFINSDVLFRLYCLGFYDKALAESQKILEIDPNYWMTHWTRGLSYSAKGMHEEAIAEQQKAGALSEGSLECLPELGYAYARAGRTAEAMKVLDKLRVESKKRFVPSSFFAFVYIGLGEINRAFELLEKSYQEHDGRLTGILIDPTLGPIRSDPRFRDLLRRMKLPMCDKK
jgi:eukaryotic-like serine/threonine-protein kinase